MNDIVHARASELSVDITKYEHLQSSKLAHLDDFSDIFSKKMGKSLDLSRFWGWLGLVTVVREI